MKDCCYSSCKVESQDTGSDLVDIWFRCAKHAALSQLNACFTKLLRVTCRCTCMWMRATSMLFYTLEH